MDLVGLRDSLFDFVQPLDALMTSGPAKLGAELGYDLTPISDSLDDVTGALNECSSSTKTLGDALVTIATASEITPPMIVDVATTCIDCIDAFRNLRSAFTGLPSSVTTHVETIMDGGGTDDFAEEFAKRFIGYLASTYLRKSSPNLHTAFNVLGVLSETYLPGDAAHFRLDCTEWVLRLEAIPRLLSDPKEWLAELYGANGLAGLELLVDRLEGFLLTQMMPVSPVELPQPSRSFVTRSIPSASLAATQADGLSADLFNTFDPAFSVSARLLPLLGATAPEAGVVAEIVAQGRSGDFAFAPSPNFGMLISTSTEAEVVARAAFFSGASPQAELTTTGALGPVRGQMFFRTLSDLLDITFKGVGGFRIDRIGVALGIEFDPDSEHELFAELELSGAELQVGGSSADGFLKKIFPGQGLHGTFDLTIGISSLRGLYASGSGGLELTLPIHQDLGPIRLESIYVGTFATPPDLELRCGVSLSGQIGPVAASVERIGARILLPTSGGDPAIRFLPPIGAGLAIAAGPVAGGGYVSHDEALSRYAGILDLKFGEIGLVAIALITTKLPGGKDGYALFVNIGVTFSPAITLPYNFNLQGVGGLLALNRTMDVEALRSGLKKKTLDSILFPEDPILNASKIISDSERVFPIEEGRFVVGPMAKLGWGANGLIVADIAVIIELPAPIVIAVLGQLVAKFPKSDEAKVVLRLDVLGILDVAKKELSIDASLYDSRIVAYELSGDSALRMRWGSNPVFALSVGGFHPKFSSPANFPKLKRLTLELSSSNSFELTCTVYHALTSNTLQLGAKVKMHAEACGAELNGHLSFDGMVVFSPFAFAVGISGGVGVSYKGYDLASVHLSVDLSGPSPWHAKGKAKFSVACFDVSAKFNKTWGNDDAATLAKLDPLQSFVDELAVESNWSATVIPRRSAVESLKSLEPGTSGAPSFLAHPAGGLEVRQRLLPLGIKLELFRNAEVTDHFRFDLKLQLLRGTTAVSDSELDPDDTVKEHFARGQYKELSKSDRLSQASYEKFRAGARVTPMLARLDGRVEEVDLQFESILIRPDGYTERNERAAGPKWSKAKRAIRLAAMQRVNARRRGLGRFMTGAAPRVDVAEEGYVIVDKATLQRATAVHPDTDPAYTLTEALDRVEDFIENGTITPDTVTVIPEFEVQPA